MKTTAIMDLMVKDHGKIVKLLNTVEVNLDRDIISLMKAFDTFNWELEKHIFTEEKAIFSYYSPENVVTGYAMMPNLIKEHNVLLNKLDVMRKELIKKRPVYFDEFKDLLIRHKNFEERSLYPKLDQDLDDASKKIIIERIGEII